MRARSEAYARSDDSNSSNACVRFDIVGGVGVRDVDKDAISSLRPGMTEGESGRPENAWSPSKDCGSSFKSIDSNSPDNVA